MKREKQADTWTCDFLLFPTVQPLFCVLRVGITDCWKGTFFLLQKGLKHLVFQVCPWIWYKFHKNNDTLNELLSVTSEHMIHAFNKDPLHSCYFPTEILCVTLSCAPLVWTSRLSIWHTALTLLPSACASCALGHLYLNDYLKRVIFSLPLHWNSVQRKTENDSQPSGCCAEKKSNGNNLKRLNY